MIDEAYQVVAIPTAYEYTSIGNIFCVKVSGCISLFTHSGSVGGSGGEPVHWIIFPKPSERSIGLRYQARSGGEPVNWIMFPKPSERIRGRTGPLDNIPKPSEVRGRTGTLDSSLVGYVCITAESIET